MSTAKPHFVMDGYDFVAYANRNSVPFREFYNIPEADTVIRGSLRYAGNPAFVHALIQLGWLDQGNKEWLKDGLTWAQVQQKAIGAEEANERHVKALLYRSETILTHFAALLSPELRTFASSQASQKVTV